MDQYQKDNVIRDMEENLKNVKRALALFRSDMDFRDVTKCKVITKLPFTNYTKMYFDFFDVLGTYKQEYETINELRQSIIDRLKVRRDSVIRILNSPYYRLG